MSNPLIFAYRTLRRIRQLGMTLDAQSRVYAALVAYQAEMDARLTATDQQLAAQVRDLVSSQAILERQLGELRQQYAALARAHDEVRNRFTEQHAVLARQVRLSTSYTRLLRQRDQAARTGEPDVAQGMWLASVGLLLAVDDQLVALLGDRQVRAFVWRWAGEGESPGDASARP